MRTMKIIKIDEIAQLSARMAVVKDAIEQALAGGTVEVIIQRPSKTRELESKYHVMIADIARTVELEGRKFDAEIWKAKLVEEFEQEMKRANTPLSHPGRTTLSLDTQRYVTIRASTKQFRVHEASQFVAFLYATGTDMGARFSEPSMKFYEDIQR